MRRVQRYADLSCEGQIGTKRCPEMARHWSTSDGRALMVDYPSLVAPYKETLLYRCPRGHKFAVEHQFKLDIATGLSVKEVV